jgi:hypothetical protein
MERPYKSQKSEVRSQNEDFVIVIICSLFLISYFLFPSYVVLHGWETQPRASRAISYFLFPISYFLLSTVSRIVQIVCIRLSNP